MHARRRDTGTTKPIIVYVPLGHELAARATEQMLLVHERLTPPTTVVRALYITGVNYESDTVELEDRKAVCED